MVNDEINQQLEEHIEICLQLKDFSEMIISLSNSIIKSIESGGKILIFGNGGSAADAQHIAAELVGRFKYKRKGLPALALTTDTSALTSISNDFGYENVFKRQLEALIDKRDIVIGISTSGSSINVINALIYSKEFGANTFGLSGNDGGDMNNICDINIVIPSKNTARIQEFHILLGHIICGIVDSHFSQ